MYRLLELSVGTANLADLGVKHAIWVAIEALVMTPSVLLSLRTILSTIRNSWNLFDNQVVFVAIDVLHSRLFYRCKLTYNLAHDI
jgi:hypothetical protein